MNDFTVLQLQMLLHYASIAEPYGMNDPKHGLSMAVQTQRNQLVNIGYLELNNEWGSVYRTTPRGDAYIKVMKNLRAIVDAIDVI